MQEALKVLIVDDSNLQADILESILNDLGINSITKAVNGVHAVKHFKEALLKGEPYPLVFLDIVMPQMDGQEALKRIRNLEQKAGVSEKNKSTIIMITSLSSPKDMITALTEGDCTDYVVKPVAATILKATLQKYGLLG